MIADARWCGKSPYNKNISNKITITHLKIFLTKNKNLFQPLRPIPVC